MKKRNNLIINIITVIAFLTMLIINILANTLPINGLTTSQVAALYFNLFTPSSITSLIEIFIYVLFAAYILYEFGCFKKDAAHTNSTLAKKIGAYFSIAAFANAAWVFAWHYGKITLSVGIMGIILLCMVIINWNIHKQDLSIREKIFIKLPFSVYYSWVTVAAIANIIAFFVSIGWSGFGISEEIWTVIGISIGMLIGSAVMVINKDIAYGMVLLWAYAGILIRHISVFGFAGQYPLVINTVNVCIILIVVFQAHVFFSSRVKEMRK